MTSIFLILWQPFIDQDYFIHNYFPKREIGIIIPVLTGLLLSVVVLTFLSFVMINSRPQRPVKEKEKSS